MSEFDRDEMNEDIELKETDTPEADIQPSLDTEEEKYQSSESSETDDGLSDQAVQDEPEKSESFDFSLMYAAEDGAAQSEEAQVFNAEKEDGDINAVESSDSETPEPSVIADGGEDETADAPISSKKKIKSNKPMAKKKKTALALVISLCIVAVVLSIVLPIVFYRVPRIFVTSKEDFVAGNKVGDMKKYFYALQKDVNCDSLTLDGDNVYSIDLRGKTLAVDGDFAILTDKEGTLYIGSRKSNDEYVANKSELKASKIIVDAPNLDVVLMADISCENLEINAKSLKIGSFKNGEFTKVDMNITAQQVTFVGNMSGSTSSAINLSHCDQVVVVSGVNISNTINLTSSKMTVESGATLATVNLDADSYATVSGSVTNAITGGRQVTMLKGHTCNTYQDIDTLVIFRNLKVSQLIKNCKNVIYVEKLVAPIDINIEERDSRIYCNVAGVKYASGYRFEINGEVVSETGAETTEIDITDRVKDVGTYDIKVTPIGNYSENSDLTQAGHRTMYTDGDNISVKYDCVMQLKAPSGLSIDENRVLKFNSVMHAQFYFIWVDGDFVVRSDITSTEEDLSKYIGTVGNHSIRVQAFNTNDNILNSPVSMYSYSSTEKLEAVDEETLKANFNADHTVINVSWQGVADGYEYIVYLEYGGRKIEVGRTSIVDEVGVIAYTINFEDIDFEYDPDSEIEFRVSVVAAEHDYYTQSDESVCTVRQLGVTNGIR